MNNNKTRIWKNSLDRLLPIFVAILTMSVLMLEVNAMTIGGRAGGYFNGTMDEIRIWNTSLSSDEAYQQYAANLNKHSADGWYLYINQSLNASDRLRNGTYSYQVFSSDSYGNKNSTEIRYITIAGIDDNPPVINFTYPTPSNGSAVTTDYFLVNISINESSLGEVKYDFEGINYSYYNDSLILMMNFDNVSSIGEAYNSTEGYRVVDLSRGGNNGTVYANGTATSGPVWNSSGRYGGAFKFDGIDDYVDLGNLSNIGFGNQTDDFPFTLQAWIKADSLDKTQLIMAKYDTYPSLVQGEFWFRINPNNGIEFVIVDTPGDKRLGINTSPVIDNDWHLVTGVYNASRNISGLKIFVDGVEQATSVVFNNSDYVAMHSTNGTFKIGRYTDSAAGGGYFNGTMDEVRVWNMSLSKDEIYQEYVSNLNRYNSSQWYLQVNQSLNASDGLSDGDYTFQAHASDNEDNWNSTEIRTVTIDATIPTVNIISPINDSRFNISTADFNVSTTEAVEWCGLSISGGANITMSLNSSNTGANYTNSTLSDGWHTFVVYCNDSTGNSGESEVYVFLVDTVSPNSSLVPDTPINGTAVTDNYFLVNVSVADTNNVSTFIDFDNSLVGWYRFGEESLMNGSTLYDYSSYGNNGTVYANDSSGGARDIGTYAGYFGRGGSFDGEGDYVNISGEANFDFERNSSFSMCAWIKPVNSSTNYQAIISKMTDSWTGYQLFISGYSEIRNPTALGVVFSNTNVANDIVCYSPNSSISHGWQFVCSTYNGSSDVNGIKLYIDGVNQTIWTVRDGLTSSMLNSGNLEIGHLSATNYPEWFNGTIDDVMIFNRTLSDDEISGLYANTSSGYLLNNFTDLEEGDHTFAAYVQDLGGNVNSTEERVVTIDTTAINLTLTAPVNGSKLNNSIVTFNVSSGEVADWCGLSIDSGANVSMSLSSTYANLTNSSMGEGWHTVVAYCNDSAGNIGSSSTISLLVDTVSPNIAFEDPTPDNNVIVADEHAFVNVSASDLNNMSTFIDFDGSLILWYRFSEGSLMNESIIYDYSSYGNNGTVYSSSSIREISTSAGYFGKGGSFNGEGDYIDFGTSALISSGPVTMSLWINSNSSSIKGLADLNISSGMIAYYGASDASQAAMFGFRGEHEIYSPASSLDTNVWHHLVFVYTGEDDDLLSSYMIFIDGVNQSLTRRVGGIGGSITRNYIANDNSASNSNFNGTIDDVMIFNRTLSENEIQGLYANTSSRYVGGNFSIAEGEHTYTAYTQDIGGNINSTSRRVTVDLTYPSISFTSPTPADGITSANSSVEINISVNEINLDSITWNWNGSNYTFFNDSVVLMMNFDNRSGLGENSTHVVDVSRSRYNGTTNAVVNATGRYGRCLSFNGTSTYVNLTSSAGLNITGDFTVSAWIKTSQNTVAEQAIVTKSDQDNQQFLFEIGSNWGAGKVICGVWSGYVNTSGNYADGNWHHAVCVGSVGGNVADAKIYMDGREEVVGMIASGTFSWSNDEPIRIGRRGDGQYFNGNIDDVIIFNRTLSAAEIKQLYFMNIHKYNSTQWYLYVNQSLNATDGLTDGTYTYQGFVDDKAGNENRTEERSLTVDGTMPSIDFVAPTPVNDTNTTNVSIRINISITEANLDRFVWNWNNTNYTFFNDSLILMMNFDNVSGIGESYNSTEGYTIVDVSGNGNDGIAWANGTSTTGPVWNASEISGGAFYFDGVDDYINISNMGMKLPTSEVTVNLWVKVPVLRVNTAFNLVPDNGSNRFLFHPYYGAARSNIYWDFGNISSTGRLEYNESLNNINTWQFFTLVSSSIGDYQAVYRNGIREAYKNSSDNLTPREGSLILGTGSLNSTYYQGWIDELSIYNRSFSSDEVKQLYYSNLKKYDADKWYFLVNESYFEPLGSDSYNYSACAIDTTGKENCTELRIFNVYALYPGINFTDPTPANSSVQADNYVEINVTINESSLKDIRFEWNGTNRTIYNDSLILMYNFDNVSAIGENYTNDASSNETIVDVSYVGKDGMKVANSTNSGPWYNASGKYGGAFEFDGIDDYIQIGNLGIVENGTATIMMWFKRNRIGAADGIFSNVYIHGNNKIYFRGTNSLFNYNFDSVGEWYHIAMSYSGDISSANLYVNGGNAIGTTIQAGAQDIDSLTNFAVGRHYDKTYFNGTIDEVMVFNRTLNYSEVLQYYQSNLKKYSSSGWNLYVNKSFNASTGLTDGSYTYRAHASDISGNWNGTEERKVTVDGTAPSWYGNSTNATLMRIYGNATFNITVMDQGSGLSFFVFSWNGTGIWDNYTNGSISGSSVKLVVNRSSNLSRGSTVGYRWYANDSLGNWNMSLLRTFVVVNSVPETPVVSYPINLSNYKNISYINYSSGDADGDSLTYEIYINGSLNVTLVDVNLTDWNASEGYYNLTVVANDGVDSSGNSSVVEFRIDNVGPSWSGNETNASLSGVDGNSTFNITVSDSGSGMSYYIFSWNGTGIWDNYTNGSISGSSVKLVVNRSSNLSRGSTVGYRWYANDSAGNWNSSLLRLFTVFNNPPSAPIIIYPSDSSSYRNVSYINYSSTDADGDSLTYNVYINGSLNISGISWNVTEWNASDGYYNITVTAYDGVDSGGNSSVVEFMLDSTAPIVSVIKPVNNSRFNISSVDFNVSTNEEVEWCGLSIGGGANVTMTLNDSNTSANYTNSSIDDGWHTFVAYCNDSAGNIGSSSVYGFLVDTVYPGINFTDPTPANSSSQADSYAFVNVSASDSLTNVSVFVDSDDSLVSWWGMDDINSTGGLVDYMGRYNGTLFGNTSQTDAGYFGKGMRFEANGSYIRTSQVIDVWEEITMSFWFRVDDFMQSEQYMVSQSYFFCLVPGGSSQTIACKNSWGSFVWANISNDVWYHAVVTFDDSENNLSLYINGEFNDSISETNSLPPGIFTMGDASHNLGAAPFNGTLDDVMIFNRSLSSDEIRGLYANKSSRYLEANFTGLDEGDHEFIGYVQDLGGNMNATDIRVVTVDTTAPSWSDNSTNATLVGINGNATFNINVSDSGAGMSYYIFSWNGTGSWDNLTNGSISGESVRLVVNRSTNLPQGNAVGYRWYANDSLGNWNMSLLRTFVVVNSVPETPVVSYPTEGNYTDIPYINYSSSDADGDSLTYEIYINGSLNVTLVDVNLTDWNASDGYYNLTVVANDGVDSSANSGVVEFMIDSTAPYWSGNETNASSSKVDGNSTFNITVSDYGSGLSAYVFSWNGTGGWDNYTNGSISGSSVKLVVNKSSNLSRGSTVGYRWYTNDSLGNWNMSLLRTFVVVNSVPERPGVDYPMNLSNYKSIDYINYSSGDVDGDSLTYEIYVNGSLNVTLVDVNLTDWNASDGYYNLTVVANDGVDSSGNSSVVEFRIDNVGPSFSENRTNASSNTFDDTEVQLNLTITGDVGLGSYILSHNDTADGNWTNESSVDISGASVVAIVNYSISNFPDRGGIFGWKIWVNDTLGNANISDVYTLPVENKSVPPVITDTYPSGVVRTWTFSMNATTDEPAECRYVPSTEGNITTVYADMPYNFSGAGLDHNVTLTLTNGNYTYHVRCMNSFGTVMTESTNISFRVDVETITVSVPGAAGGGGGGGSVRVDVEKNIILEIDVPSSSILASGGDRKIKVRFRNFGDVILNDIQIGAKTNAPNVDLSLENKAIGRLGLNQQYETFLTIKSLEEEKAHIGINRYIITVYADVLLYDHREEMTFFLDVKENDYERRIETLKEINFVTDLFEENPECMQFSGILADARDAYEKSDYDKSLSLVDSAIEGCKDEVTSEEEEVIEEPAPEKKSKNMLFVILLLIILVLLGAMFYYFRNKGGKGREGKESGLDSMFDSLFDRTQRSIRKNDLANAQKGYLAAYNIYKRVVASALPNPVKARCYRRLSLMHLKLAKAIKRK